MIDELIAVKEDAKKDVAAWKDMMARQNEFLLTSASTRSPRDEEPLII